MCRTLDECDPLPTTIAMEYLPGCEYTVDLLADHGRVLCIAGRRNYESRASIAMATYTEEKRGAYDLCRRIVELLRLDGNIGFDFMLTDRDASPPPSSCTTGRGSTSPTCAASSSWANPSPTPPPPTASA